MKDLKQNILKYALQNAVKYNGKARVGNVIPKLLHKDSSLRKDMKNISKQVNEIVKEVNVLNCEEQLNKLKKIAPELLEDKPKEKKKLKELDFVDKERGVVMRFAPSPSGPMHLGHAITGGLTSLYVKKYGGKFILRIEDTNPDNIYKPAYKLLPKDAEWIFGNVSKVWIQSERMNIYYDYVEKLLTLGVVYVCTCSPEDFRECVKEKADCPCRNLGVRAHKKRWDKMFKEYKEGEAVLRFKADMKHKNPAMRDFPLARINDSEHPRQGKKYRVWPLMNLSVAVDDIEAGMTHIIRAKDHADNAKRQKLIFKALGYDYPEAYFTGRYKFKGLELSCSKTRKRIESGEFDGWDDIRLPFIGALKRRGYQPEAFLKYSEEIGLSNVDKVVEGEEFFKHLSNLNKEILDSKVNRYFFVKDPIKIKIRDAPKLNVQLKLHPDHEKRGYRYLNTKEEFYISKEDYKNIKNGALYRLMDAFNFVKEGDSFVFVSEDLEEYKKKGKGIIHWLPMISNLVKTEVLMPDNKLVKGLSEPLVDGLKKGQIVQFERFGFCRLDDFTDNKIRFWFGHK
jgi:glutamyl-tRNA synthetase